MSYRVGIFGDSYAQSYGTWAGLLKFLLPKNSRVDVFGKGGSNQFYAVQRWHEQESQHGADHYDFVIFTFTWHRRLYHSIQYRNQQFCLGTGSRKYSDDPESCGYEDDPEIKDDLSYQQFIDSVELYYQYLYDDDWAKFNYDLTVRYIMQDIPRRNPASKFIFIPNTEFARSIAKKYFESGVLLDFAFEELSNREPGSPGPMPVNCGRAGHLNGRNHKLFGNYIKDLIQNYDRFKNQTVPLDLDQFDVVK